MSLFSNLPCEIFRKIIIYTDTYVPEPVVDGGSHLDLQSLPPPIITSHVCRSWRHALLSDPTMWTCLTIPELSNACIIELLRRSGSSPLNVSIKLETNDYSRLDAYVESNVFSFLFREMHRFKILSVEMDYDNEPPIDETSDLVINQIFLSLQQPAPQLRTFCFRGSDDSINETLLHTLFSGNAPNLKSIQYLPLDDFPEINNPLFQNLSELYLYLPRILVLDVGRFLNILELSPRLELLSLQFGSKASVEGTRRVIDLPCLQRLVLSTYGTTDIVETILECIKVPSNFKWSISAHCSEEFTGSPSLLQLMSQAHFSSLNIEFADSGSICLVFEEEGGVEDEEEEEEKNITLPYTGRFNDKRLAYSYEEASDLQRSWHPLLESTVFSNITYLDIVFRCTSLSDDDDTIFPIIFGTLHSLDTLVIRHDPEFRYGFEGLQSILVCLSALVPNLEQKEASECKPTSTENPVPDPDLDSVSTTESGHSTMTLEGTSSHRSTPTAAFPCPSLCELVVSFGDGTLSTACAAMLCVVYTRRVEEGYPLQIFVHCPKMRKRAALILRSGRRNEGIRISSAPYEY